jgi:hypothetical protein
MTLDNKVDLLELVERLSDKITDWTLEELLYGMKLAFDESETAIGEALGLKGFDKNIEGFEAVYAFGTMNGDVQATAVFANGKMAVDEGTPAKWDLNVAFKDIEAFWNFLFSGGDNILESLLANDVELFGNVNHVYKFGFMARDLQARLGLG